VQNFLSTYYRTYQQADKNVSLFLTICFLYILCLFYRAITGFLKKNNPQAKK